MSGTHSELSPSSSSRWLACPGSVRRTRELKAGLLAAANQAPLDEEMATLLRAIIADESDAAEEGTDAHELAALCLSLDVDAVGFIGKTLPNGNDVDDEMADSVQQYLDYVRALPGDHLVEDWLDLSRVTGEKDGGGTGDHVALTRDAIYVTDFKYGRTPVEIVGNTQTRCYAAGALQRQREGNGPFGAPERVVMAVVQPRVFSAPQIEEISGTELADWIENVLTPGATATREPDAPLVPGPVQCHWCRAKGDCPALAQHAVRVTGAVDLSEFAGGFTPPAPSGLSGEQLGDIAGKAAMVRKWLDAVDAEITTRLLSGQRIGSDEAPWKLVRGKKGNRTWVPEQEDAIAGVLRTNYGLSNETIFAQKMLSPTAILSLPAVKEAPDLLAAFIAQKEGSLTPAPFTDKRAAHVPRDLIAAGFETID